MRIKNIFPEIQQRQHKSKKEKKVIPEVRRGDQDGQVPRTPVLSAQRPRRMSDFMKSPYLKSFSPSSKSRSTQKHKLASVAEEEEMAFNYQMALLEDPPEWDLDAGIGSRDFESPSLTPPAITTSRASSPSHIEKVAESSRKQFQKIASKLHHLQDAPASPTSEDGFDDRRLSKSEPDLSKLAGKGNAGSLSQQANESSSSSSRGRSRTIGPDQEVPARRSRSGPPSWRMPPKNIRRSMPHVREASPLPSFPIGPVDLKYHESSVMARAMWKHGEVRYEDQWGRRLVPIGRQNSFMFELWPVSEITEE
ncbi:hypothetical protein H072_11506 [Dactylellina haptotyla CBS 200.50]|uniref:Uncharacterized protein n=1 Tax=Dactylellina haptotyla (strain CBS 200.50) TaxID=1284197 RepID=S8A1S3_DACHA|nr:hypothetical protein H072_11506 [Dactylellina haptotyla CBS 200.50]